MKESELIKKMSPISSRLKRTNIIDKCHELARTYGKGRTRIESGYTKLNYFFEEKELKIDLNDGWSMMGGGEIKVYFEEGLVLYGDRYACDGEKNRFNPKMDGFCILTYKQGPWEERIKKLLIDKKKPKIEKKENKEVEGIIIKLLEKNFTNF